MNLMKILFLFLILLLPIHTFSQGNGSYYQQISRAIIRLEDDSSRKSVGTAFFVHYRSDSNYYYLVTARHVVESNRVLRARVPSQRLDNGQTEVIELRLPKDIWTYHPIGLRTINIGNKKEDILPIDVAVTKLPGIKEHKVREIYYDKFDKKANQISNEKVEPPAQIIVWGFPGNLGFDLEEQHPLGRVGIVAMSAKKPFVRTESILGVNLLRDEQVLLIDAPILPGNSGSPILDFSPFKGKVMLIGLISASNINSNYAVAEPSIRIIEAIEYAFNNEQKTMGSWHPLK